MAQIPSSRFGYESPQIRRSSLISAASRVEPAYNGTGRIIAGVLNDISAEMQTTQEIHAKKKRVEAATAVMNYETQLQSAEQDIEKQYNDGTLSSDAMLGARDQAEKKIRESIVGAAQGLSEEDAASFHANIEARNVNLKESFQRTALGAAKKDYQASIENGLDAFRRANLGNSVAAEAYVNGDYGHEIDKAFGRDAQEVKRRFIEQSSRDSVTVAIGKAGEDVSALSRVESQLNGEEAAKRFDPDYLLQVRSSLSSRINSLQERNAARAEREQYKRDMAAERASKEFEDHILNGGVASLEMLDNLRYVTAGTVYNGVADQYAKRQDQVQGLLSADEKTQREWVANARAKMQKDGSTPEELKFVDSIESQINKKNAMRKNNPLEADEIDRGGDITSVDWKNPNPDDVAERESSRQIAIKRTGSDPGILKETERKELAASLSGHNMMQKRQVLVGLQSSLTPETYQAVMNEVYKDNPVASHAGQLLGIGATKAANSILRGEEILNDPNMKNSAPADKDFDIALQAQAGGAFTGAAESYGKARESLKAAYVANAETAGRFGQKVDPEIMKSTISQVLGTIVEHNDSKIIAPYGMDEDTFLDKAESEYNKLGASTPFSRITLAPYDVNKYVVMKQGAIIKQRGRPVVIEVK